MSSLVHKIRKFYVNCALGHIYILGSCRHFCYRSDKRCEQEGINSLKWVIKINIMVYS